jgi:hypothetical protein
MTELVQLPHFVSVEKLTVDQINALIDRAEYFQAGGRNADTDPTGLRYQHVL